MLILHQKALIICFRSLFLEHLHAQEVIPACEGWTVEKFLQRGQKQVILYFHSPLSLLELTLYYASTALYRQGLWKAHSILQRSLR